jgi:hypothetical protein
MQTYAVKAGSIAVGDFATDSGNHVWDQTIANGATSQSAHCGF